MKPTKLNTFILLILLSLSWSVSKSQQVSIDATYPDFCKSGDRCTVNITIEKGNIQGFARIQQTLPDGFSATLLEDGGSDFIFDKQKISFIWLSIPATPNVTVSYAITGSKELAGTYTIEEGAFSYLLDNKITRQPIPGAPIDMNKRAPKVSREPVAAAEKPDLEPVKNMEEVKENTGSTEKESSLEEKKPKTTEATEAPQPKTVEIIEVEKPIHAQMEEAPQPKPVELTKAEKPNPVEVIDVPKAKTEPVVTKDTEAATNKTAAVDAQKTAGITYRIQFAALKTYQEIPFLKQQYKISDHIYHETDGIWHRYTFGSWNNAGEAAAANASFKLSSEIDSFIVKYMDGKRM